ncbi:MAG: copper-binding protein [Burkholderiales bacterium PBB5]|nr:MAG: copper-binding protein [Burkholderiales bacterium PBB5]
MTIRLPARTLLTALAGLSIGLSVLAQTTDAEVRKIDRDQGKITLRHAEIKNLDMPAMTMVFRVANPQLLDGLAEGSKVKFDAEKVNGQYTVVRLVLLP